MYSCYFLQVLKVHTCLCFLLGDTEAIDPNTCAGSGGGYEDSTATEWAGCDVWTLVVLALCWDEAYAQHQSNMALPEVQ